MYPGPRLGQELTVADFSDVGGVLIGLVLGGAGAHMVMKESGFVQALGIGLTVMGTAVFVAEVRDLYS